MRMRMCGKKENMPNAIKAVKPKKPKPKILDMEIAISNFYNPRKYLIVPNLSWGMFHYELDMCILSQSGYATEVEIKTSKADLIKDKEKRHGHRNKAIKYLYFAIPEHLLEHKEHIPKRAGILVVRWNEPLEGMYYSKRMKTGHFSCRKHQEAEQNGTYKWIEADKNSLLRLAAMRTWTLKRQLQTERKKLW